jgi:hypothetical protein
MANAQRPGFRPDVELQPQRLKQVFRVSVHLRPVDAPHLLGLPPDVDVLRDVQVGEQVGLLVDGGNRRSLRLARVRELHRLTLQQYLAAVGLVYAGDNLDQSGLTRPVLTEKSVNFTCVDIKLDIFQRLHASKRFVDASHRNNRLCCSHVKSLWCLLKNVEKFRFLVIFSIDIIIENLINVNLLIVGGCAYDWWCQVGDTIKRALRGLLDKEGIR